MSLAEPSLIFILLLYLFLLTIGIWVAKKITSVGTEQLFLAGRTIGLTVGSISMAGKLSLNRARHSKDNDRVKFSPRTNCRPKDP